MQLHLGGRIILKRILKEQGVKMWAGLKWLRMGPSGGIFEHGHETQGSLKGEEFLDPLSDY